ncbi:CHASE2 domain-containing protein [Calothrix rhizosoleniae]|uniref:CHASE2 domain-containing protein n=1 Tax=Calothrix rhizosoleniae TaxID=888997 RepID=UPI000B4A015D|nr:CHASE2 domain-containing serine/threonine-protein kinase [Calothrix rhizosoleniae]
MTGILQKLYANLVKNKITRNVPQERTYSDRNNWLLAILIASVGVSAVILGARELKWLQRWELNAYDRMLRLRTPEKPNHRIVLVTINEADLRATSWPLPDKTINQLLTKIESFQPRVIGLNLYRPEQKNLAVGLKNPQHLIGLCKMSTIANPAIPPPTNLPSQNIGFSDLMTDEDVILRRVLLFASSNDQKCATNFSFASLLAIDYLQKQGIDYNFHEKTNAFKLGKITFPQLTSDSGSYESLDAAGYQILLNYRHPNQFTQITLTEVLNNQVKPGIFKDKLVIIGTSAASIHPGFYTPYSADPAQPARMPAVLIHAQIASQLLSSVLDGRSLIQYWSQWVEFIWICGWSLLGSGVVWRWRQHPLRLAIVGGTVFICLLGICIVSFFQALWIPVIPPALAFFVTGIGVMTYTNYHTQQDSQIIVRQVETQKEAIEQLNTLLNANTGIQDTHNHFDTEEKKTGDFLLGGRYKINQVLGSGGFGCTYLAADTQRPGNPICVVKQLMPARRDTNFLQVARRLFNTEAEILEALGKHNHIPSLLAYFEDNHEFYLVQQYIQGTILSDELPPKSEKQDEKFVVKMLREVLQILIFVHEHRVIHRDIKPGNIIRNQADNHLVLIDFGAVKTMQPPTSEQTELATVAIGTRGYAPPEQFAGHPRLSSDIYALGMIGIQAVTGIPPHELPANAETGCVEWHQWAKITPELVAVLDKMVNYHFSDRYQSAAAVLEDLQKIKLSEQIG